MCFNKFLLFALFLTLMFIRFIRKRFLVLKFLFIEVIHSIFLILVQYVPALLVMCYNTQTCKVTHNIQHNTRKCVRRSKWLNRVKLKGILSCYDIEFKNLLDIHILVLILTSHRLIAILQIYYNSQTQIT